MFGLGLMLGSQDTSGISPRGLIGRVVFVLFVLLCFGFKPGPRPGLPRFFVDDSLNVRLISLSGKSIIENGGARVSFSVMFELDGTGAPLYPIFLFIRADSLEMFINGEKYSYVPSGRDILMVHKGFVFLQMSYWISTNYTFSGPPGEWIYGECFELSSPFVRNTPSSSTIKPEQFSFVVVVPKEFTSEIAKFGWERRIDDERVIFFTSNPDILDCSNYWYLQVSK